MKACVNLLRSTIDTDVLEKCTNAIDNLIASSRDNRRLLCKEGGLEVILDLIASPKSVESELISANCAETLANITRDYDNEILSRIISYGVKPLILLCASSVLQVKRSCALAIGNIAQSDESRKAIGEVAAVEALFLVCDYDDPMSQANACWALSNLAWTPENQEKIGEYLPQLLSLIKSIEISVRTHAVATLANSLYFHEGNRRKLGGTPDALNTLTRLCCTPYPKFQAHLARAIGSAAYNDVNSRLIGLAGGVEELTKLCYIEDPEVQQYAAFALGNLAVHDGNKSILRHGGGIEALVKLNASMHPAVVKAANEALEVMSNMTNQADLSKKRDSFNVGGLVDLMNADSPLVQGLAAEALAEETYIDLNKQDAIGQAKGVEALVKILRTDSGPAVIRALWALRNATYKHQKNKEAVGKTGGIRNLLRLASESHKPEQVECALACLANVCIDSEMNCRLVMSTGLDVLIDIGKLMSIGDIT